MSTKVTWLQEMDTIYEQNCTDRYERQDKQQQQTEVSEPDENTEEQLCDRYTDKHQ